MHNEETTPPHGEHDDPEFGSGLEDEAPVEEWETDDEEQEAPANQLERLRKRRAEKAEEAASGERTLTLPVPGYDDELFLHFVYHADAWDRLKSIGQRAIKSKHPRKELHAAQDTLAYAIADILVSEDGGMTTAPLDPDGAPTRFDAKCARLLGFEVTNQDKHQQKSREVVSKVFENDLAITAMGNKVSVWMQGEDEEVNEDF